MVWITRSECSIEASFRPQTGTRASKPIFPSVKTLGYFQEPIFPGFAGAF